jgi:hypothetical protein
MMRLGSWKRAAAALAGAVALAGPVAGVATAIAPATAGAVPQPTLTLSTSSLGFRPTTLGTFTLQQYTVSNNTASEVTLTGFERTGPDANDFTQGPDDTTDCPDFNIPANDVTLQVGHSCVYDVLFFPDHLDFHQATLTLTDQNSAPVSGTSVTTSGLGAIGYYQVTSGGAIGYAGDAAFYGDLSNTPLNSPIVGIAQTGNNGGYWLAAADGGVFTFGPSATFHGSAGGLALNKPIVGIAAPPAESGLDGYWLVATDGGIFSYGLPFYGSTGSIHLNKPIVGMASTNDGGGYWLVASDGGIFAYGDAQFYGSTGAIRLNKPIVGMTPTPDNGGYWLVASDGGIFAYGDARFYGSTGAIRLAQPIVGMAAMPDGSGYWFSAADGGLFNYGAPFYGAANSLGIGNVVAMTTDGAPTLQAFLDLPALRAHASVIRPSWGALPHGPHFTGP